MKIALDYDDTYSRDPVGWDGFITIMTARGHEVMVVTYRDDRYDQNADLMRLARNIPVFYTRGVAKGWWCEQFGPGRIDVWTDDRPKSVYENSSFSPEQLIEWRAANAAAEAQAA